jgi:hypothetical protein
MTGPTIDWSFFSMARYLLTARADDDRVLSGGAWDGFLQRLAEAGHLIDTSIPAAAVDRASAFRGLLQFLSFGLERTLGAADPARPVLSRPWRLLSPAVPGEPQRPRPRRSLAETKDDWMAGWAEEDRRASTAASGQPRPTARVLPLAELDAALPAGTPQVTAAQRRTALDERLRQVTRLQRS